MTPMRPHRSARSAFTLLEVMVVIAIIGIIAGIGVMSMRARIAQDAVKGQAMEIKAFLERVGAQARAKQALRSVAFDGSSVQAYTGANCVAGQELTSLQLTLKHQTLPDNSSGNPPIPALLAWSCVEFNPFENVGKNALNTVGYIKVQSSFDNKIRAAVAKSSIDNRVRVFFSLDGGVTWPPL